MMDTPDYRALITAARKVRLNAYVPYSNFAVGAVVMTRTGRMFPGCNIENAAYPASVCAERVALLSAYAAGEQDIAVLAVVADTAGPVSPCGVCRQVVLELAPRCVVVLANLGEELQITTPAELLPSGFTGDILRETWDRSQ